MEKLIITAAITGAETQKTHNPNLPVTAAEQAEAAFACVQAGASIIHIHVRDEQEKPSQNINHFKQAYEAIKAKCDVIVQFSTGGAVGTPIQERLAPLDLKPEMASLNAGSLNFGDEVFENLPKDIEHLAEKMRQLDIKPEIEVYDLGMLEYGLSLVKQGLVAAPAHFQFVLGTRHGLSGDPENLIYMRNKLPENATFAVAGIGRHQLNLAPVAISLGGHVRVGLEDNIYFRKGELAKSNAQLVERVARIATEMERPVASVAETRSILKIRK